MRDPMKQAALSEAESKAFLVEQLLQLVDRTFFEGGHGAGMKVMEDMLLRFDERSLREMVLGYGIEGAEELTEPGRESEPRAPAG
jgi:hypothetical protein